MQDLAKGISMQLGNALVLLLLLWPLGVIMGAPYDPRWVAAFFLGLPLALSGWSIAVVGLLMGLVLWQCAKVKALPWGARLGYVWLYQLSGVMLLCWWVMLFRLVQVVYSAITQSLNPLYPVSLPAVMALIAAALALAVVVLWLRPVWHITLLWRDHRDQGEDGRGFALPSPNDALADKALGSPLAWARWACWGIMAVSVVLWAALFLSHQQAFWLEIPKVLYLTSIVTQLQLGCTLARQSVLIETMPKMAVKPMSEVVIK